MRKQQVADEAQGFVLDAKYQQFEWAKRALEQARLELGGVISKVGLSASAHRIARSRQWCLQVVQAAEEKAREDAGRRGGNKEKDPLPDVSDLIESVRRSGILEPLIVGVTDDDTLRVVDGHRRLRAAREAGVTSLPVMLSLTATDESDELRAPAEEAARGHRRVTFRYARPDGVEALRTVDVWGLVRRAEHAYLIGYDQDREAPRTFRLSRIVGGITFVGEGTPPPEGFSAEASVWGPLDPESLEALEESFRRILKEQRSTVEDLTTDGAAAEEDTRARLRAEVAKLRGELGDLEEAKMRVREVLDMSKRAQDDYWGRMHGELKKLMEMLSNLDQDLARLAARTGEGHAGLEEAQGSIAQARAVGEDWSGLLHEVMDEMESDQDKRQREMARWLSLDSAEE